MAPDDLATPLGPKRSGGPSGRWMQRLLLATVGTLVVVILIAAAWPAFVHDPLGGEPMVRVAIKTPAALPPPASTVERPKEVAGGEKQIVTVIDGKSGARTEVAVRPGTDNNEDSIGVAAVIDARLTQASRHGAIPRIADDGTRPLEAYSRAEAAAATRKGPHVAVVVSGLGVSASTTGDALGKLPKSITLAFVPYGTDLPRWVARARNAGYEILLQVPMEPFDYPDNDPGPQTLLSSLRSAENVDRLHWFLSRTQGYVGVTNFMGARFTANGDALGPILADIANRGLLYFDDGTSARSQTQKVAAGVKAAYLKADVVIDAKPTWSDIDAALEKLERLAVEKGFAVGSAGALPISIERITRWAKAAESRGIRVVPLSALAARSKQS